MEDDPINLKADPPVYISLDSPSGPHGLGYWIAYRRKMGAVGHAIDRLHALGAHWVAPRVGQDGWNDPDCTFADLRAYQDAKIPCFVWGYTTRKGWKAMAEAFQRIVDTGLVDGVIFNCEAEWTVPSMPSTMSAAEARVRRSAFAKSISNDAAELIAWRAEHMPDVWVGHAPPGNAWAMEGFPLELDKLDAVMPQIYAYEFNDAGNAHWLERIVPEWKKRIGGQGLTTPIQTILGSYRPHFRGNQPVPPFPGDRAVTEDIVSSLSHPLLKASSAPSLYSLEEMSANTFTTLCARAADISTHGDGHGDER